MSRSFRTEGIILKNYRFGEIHKGVVFLSPTEGLVDAVAFGACSPRGKLRTVTDPLCTGTLCLYKDPVKGLTKITDMDCRLFFPGIRESVRKFFHASVFLETVLKTFGGEGPFTFRLLVEALTLVEAIPEDQSTELLIQFLYRYLSYAGISPHMEHCSICGMERSNREPLYYHPGGVEVFCKDCSHPENGILPAGSIAYLHHTRSLSLVEALQVRLEESSLQALKRYLLSCIQSLAMGTLQSLRPAEGFL